MSEYLERRARERAFVQFTRLLRKTAMRDADHVSRTWFILIDEAIERAIEQRGCSIDDIVECLNNCAPSPNTRRESERDIEDEPTPAERPTALALEAQQKGTWRGLLRDLRAVLRWRS